MKSYVVGFAFDHKEEIVALMLKARPDWQRGRLNGIGGHIEDGEQPIDAMEREWEEETSAFEIPWALFAKLYGDGWEMYCFRGNADLTELESSSDGEEIVVCSPDELPVNVLPNLRWLVPMSRASVSHEWPYLIQERADGLLALAFPAEKGEQG